MATSLPSVGRRTGLPRATPADDAGYIQSVMSKLAEEGYGYRARDAFLRRCC
jgi:hypothetical protein